MDVKEEIGYLLGILEDPEQKVYELLKQQLINNHLEVLGQIYNHWLNPKSTLQQVLDSYLIFYKEDIKKTIPLRNNLNKIFIFPDEETYLEMFIAGQKVFSEYLIDNNLNIPLDSILRKLPLNTNYENCFFKLQIKVKKFGKLRTYQEEKDCIFDSEAYMYDCFYKRVICQLPPNKYCSVVLRNIPESILKERSKLWRNSLDWHNLDTICFNNFNLDNLVEYFEFTSSFFDVRYNEILYKRSKRDSQHYLNTLKEYTKVLQHQQPLILKGRHIYTQAYSPLYTYMRKLSLKFSAFLSNN